MYFHVQTRESGPVLRSAYNLTERQLVERILEPWHRDAVVVIDGHPVHRTPTTSIRIARTALAVTKPKATTAALRTFQDADDVTSEFLHRRATNSLPQSDLELVEWCCREFPRFVASLRNRRAGSEPLKMMNEYDVQYALKAILRLFIQDVRDEVPQRMYGAQRTRADFWIPDEGIVVETKMTRDGLTDKSVQEELIIDFANYSHDPECKHIVALVYDPEGRLRNGVAIERDLSEDDPNTSRRVFVVG